MADSDDDFVLTKDKDKSKPEIQSQRSEIQRLENEIEKLKMKN